ncbi:MAG: alanine:cation symporter family protein [Thermoguttaceae bacterium]|nr:alanine:cation symporter family protein [Thermoguttaceae bacterium]
MGDRVPWHGDDLCRSAPRADDPVYYIRYKFQGAFGKFLAGCFASVAILALGFMGAMVQSNSIAESFETAFSVPSWLVGIILVILCGFIFLGGVQRLASVTEKLVPVMAVIFLAGAIFVLFERAQYLPATFAMIFKYAFAPQAIIGGGFGTALKIAVSQGAKRGLFSNEAGLGSTPHAHALANVEKPRDQGCVAMIGVFVDTFVVLTLNALVIICTLYAEGGPLDTVILEKLPKPSPRRIWRSSRSDPSWARRSARNSSPCACSSSPSRPF